MQLHQILSFHADDGHPTSEIVGIDSYDFDANDGLKRAWQSYTLVPVDEAERIGIYERWYVVDLPDIGMSFVQLKNAIDLPETLVEEPKLTGLAEVTTIGDGELGTGKSRLWSYWDMSANPPEIYAKETFEDGSTLYFKSNPLKQKIKLSM